MKVLVTGGGGFVGRAVLNQLHAHGHAIRLLVRHPDAERARAAVKRHGVELSVGDVVAGGSLPAACAGVDAVVHLVGIIAEIGQQTFENVHARGTRNIVEAARTAGVQRFVHMSALGTRPGAASRYHQTKWSAEQTVRRSDLKWTIFRPSVVYGPGDGFVNLFVRISRFSPVLPLIGSGRTLLQPIRVEDVGKAFAQALAEPKTIRQTYDLCGPDRLTLREILGTIQRVTGRRRLCLPIPMALMRLQAAVLEGFYPACLRRPPPLSRDQLLMLEEDNTGEPQVAAELFGLDQVHFEDGIATYLRLSGG